MEIISEFVFEILLGRIIIGFFGYWTFYGFFKITKNQEKLKWLVETRKNNLNELGKGCLISIVGFITFTICFLVLYKIIYSIF
jgi:hypothetical protein